MACLLTARSGSVDVVRKLQAAAGHCKSEAGFFGVVNGGFCDGVGVCGVVLRRNVLREASMVKMVLRWC